MKKRILSILSLLLAFAIIFFAVPFSVSATSYQLGFYYTETMYYEYEMSNETVTILDCSENISGDIEIPSTLCGGYPVTAIGADAFKD